MHSGGMEMWTGHPGGGGTQALGEMREAVEGLSSGAGSEDVVTGTPVGDGASGIIPGGDRFSTLRGRHAVVEWPEGCLWRRGRFPLGRRDFFVE